MDNRKPLNFVYIFCDELRADVLSCYDGKDIETPSIDRIAENGVLFDKCYCNSPVCVASRFSILTSQYPEATGVYHNEAACPEFHLKDEWKTFPEVFAEHGYATASFGKTHIPMTKKSVFQYNDESGGEMSFGIQKSEIINPLIPKGCFKSILAGDYPDDKEYWPEKVTQNALKWIGEQSEPFFVRLSYLQPHTPIIAKKEFVEALQGKHFTHKITDYETSLFEKCFKEACDIQNMDEADVNRMWQYYLAMVLWIDSEVGKVLHYLEEHQLLENTVIIFNSDHGASRGENGALAKQTFSPQSHRIPLIISCPEKIPHKVNHDICEGIDIGPTLLSLAQLPIPKEYKGINLMNNYKEYLYSTIGYGEKNSYAFPFKQQGKYKNDQGWPRRACVRTGRYRFEMNVKIDGVFVEEDMFFCDCLKYPLENINLIDDPEYKDVVENLYTRLKKHIQNSVEVDDIEQLDYFNRYKK